MLWKQISACQSQLRLKWAAMISLPAMIRCDVLLGAMPMTYHDIPWPEMAKFVYVDDDVIAAASAQHFSSPDSSFWRYIHFFFRSHMSIVGFQGRLKPIVNQFLPRMAIFEKAFLRLTCTALAQKRIKQVQLDWASCSRCSPELRIKAWNRWFDTRRRFGWELPELAMEVSWGFVGKMIKPHWGVSKHPCLTLYLMYLISH